MMGDGGLRHRLPEESEMNWSPRKKALVVALVVLLVAAVAFAHAHHRRMAYGQGFEGHMIGFFTDYLDLTDAQQAQAKQILDKERPTVQPLIDQMAQTHQKMRTLEESGSFDESAVRVVAAQQAQTMTELLVQKARINFPSKYVWNSGQPSHVSDIRRYGGNRDPRQDRNPIPLPGWDGDKTNRCERSSKSSASRSLPFGRISCARFSPCSALPGA
jgi:Spy/CpxP family protein refolding chaperone